MEHLVSEVNLEMMIEMADPKKKGHVTLKAFMRLMGEIGIIPQRDVIDYSDSDMDEAFKAALAF